MSALGDITDWLKRVAMAAFDPQKDVGQQLMLQ
jgi:hypothetical protein